MAKILVVDDSSIMRRNLSTILTKAGHTIVGEAANGESAYKDYEKFLPDLVTMDITMPILDGIDAVKKIIKYYPDANIIMISALDQKQMVLSAIQNGAKHYIIKPFTVDKVIKVVNEVLKNSEALRKIAAKQSNIEAAKSSEGTDAAENTKNSENNEINEVISTMDDIDKFIAELNDEATPKISNTDDALLPFTIESKVNQLNITLASSIQLENFQSLNMIIQGFLFIKSLTVILDLSDSKYFEQAIINKILELTRLVTGHGANIKVTANNNEILELLKSANPFFSSIIE